MRVMLEDFWKRFDMEYKKLQVEYLDLYLIHWPNELNGFGELFNGMFDGFLSDDTTEEDEAENGAGEVKANSCS